MGGRDALPRDLQGGGSPENAVMRREIGQAIVPLRDAAQETAEGEAMHHANTSPACPKLQRVDIFAPRGGAQHKIQSSNRRSTAPLRLPRSIQNTKLVATAAMMN